MVRVFQSRDEYFNNRPLLTGIQPVTSSGMSVNVTNLLPGRYIISVHHDINADGKLNSNAFGMPTESSVFVSPSGVSDESLKPSNALFEHTGDRRAYSVSIPAPAFESRSWGAGVMALLSSNPYRGGDTVARILPMLTYIGEKLYVTGPRAGYNLFKHSIVSVNAFAEFKFAGDAFEDENFLEGMEKRRDTVMLGADASLRLKRRWRLEANASTDILDRHNGQEANLSVSRMFRFDTFSLSPGAGIVWRSSQYNEYYYGVREEEATAERPAYDPGQSVDGFLKLSARYQFNDQWSVIGVGRVEFLSDEIVDSPIIDKKTVNTMFVGLNYAF